MNSNSDIRRRAVQAALGEVPFDLLLKNAQVVDMVTGEIRPADVGIVGALIASVHPCGSQNSALTVEDLNGAFLTPGLTNKRYSNQASSNIASAAPINIGITISGRPNNQGMAIGSSNEFAAPKVAEEVAVCARFCT